MKRPSFAVFLLMMAAAFFSAPSHTAPSGPVLGNGRGPDHVGIAVRDLAATMRDFERLGFTVKPGGRFPGGLSNAIIFIGAHFYLELLAAAPNHTKDVADIADFAAKHEGAMFLGLNVSSAKDTAAWLRAHDFDVSGPDPGSIMTGNQKKLPPPMWYSVAPADKPAQGKRTFALPIFFIQYLNEATRAKRHAKDMAHPNTAMSARAVWFVTKDPGAQIHSLQEGGFEGATSVVALAGIRGKAVPAGVGSLDLLQSSGQSGLLSADDNRIVAVSLQVKDLLKASQLARASIGHSLPIYAGTYGRSIFIPPAAAHGLGIELFQP